MGQHGRVCHGGQGQGNRGNFPGRHGDTGIIKIGDRKRRKGINAMYSAHYDYDIEQNAEYVIDIAGRSRYNDKTFCKQHVR